MLDFTKIFEDKHASVFDNMDKVARMITEAEGDEEQPDESEQPDEEEQPAEGEEPAPEEEAPVDPTQAPEEMPMEEGEPADEGDGIYVSANEKATLAKAMLDALQADPPKPGEIPDNLLNVTSANADDVIKFIQSLTSLSNATSLADNGDKDGLVNTLKSV